MCNTIGIISNGKLVARGTPDEVRKLMSKDANVRIIVRIGGEHA